MKWNLRCNIKSVISASYIFSFKNKEAPWRKSRTGLSWESRINYQSPTLNYLQITRVPSVSDIFLNDLTFYELMNSFMSWQFLFFNNKK